MTVLPMAAVNRPSLTAKATTWKRGDARTEPSGITSRPFDAVRRRSRTDTSGLAFVVAFVTGSIEIS